jgi:hypothetical protein
MDFMNTVPALPFPICQAKLTLNETKGKLAKASHGFTLNFHHHNTRLHLKNVHSFLSPRSHIYVQSCRGMSRLMDE